MNLMQLPDEQNSKRQDPEERSQVEERKRKEKTLCLEEKRELSKVMPKRIPILLKMYRDMMDKEVS